jgi:hypothetical protein
MGFFSKGKPHKERESWERSLKLDRSLNKCLDEMDKIVRLNGIDDVLSYHMANVR